MLARGNRVQRGLDQPGLADAGFADEEHRLALAGDRLPPALEHERQFLVAPDHGQNPARSPGFEAAAGDALAENFKPAHRWAKPLSRVGPSSRSSNSSPKSRRVPSATTTAPGGRLLQPRRQIRRFAHHLLAGGALADEVPHDHKTAGDADPCAERLAGRRGQLADRLRDRQARPHGALGLVLMRLRPAEIGEHAVAHELGDVTPETGDLARHGVLVGAQDLPHLFRVEPLRQRGRAHQVTEQHRELPPFGVWSHPRGCSLGRLMRQRVPFACLGLVPQGGDGVEQPATMADERNAEVLEVVAGQIGQEAASISLSRNACT